MKVLELIKKRRSVRAYKDKDIETDAITKLIEAAIWSPSGSNIHAWSLVILQKEENIRMIKAFSPGLLGDPATLFILCADKKKAYEKGGELGRDVLSLMDIAIAAQNICLEATELGIGSCIIRSFNQKAVNELLKLPETVVPELMVSLGYPLTIPESLHRRGLEEAILYWDKKVGR